MAVLKCKMCGASLNLTEDKTICECEYCGTLQTLPISQDDTAVNLFNRANNLRSKSEFDKAQDLYEKLVALYPNDSESYWGLVLCKYGIEYVEDPKTLNKIPTCHRTQLESVQTDADFLSALEHADSLQYSIYEHEAAKIDQLQKEIIAIAKAETPFDVFICYKETDSEGKRTQDSVIANDIYHLLTREGFKVFYSAITLEEKLGQEYEPYIYAALHSAKVMLVIGTKPEYYDAVWVRNEWSRYLKIAREDKRKLIIPCYKDMDAYELPEEFSHLQAQDMSKIGFVQDLIRGINKTINTNKAQTSTNNSSEVLQKNIEFLIEDEKWEKADELCDELICLDSTSSIAYFYKIIIGSQLNKNISIYGKHLEQDCPKIAEKEKKLLLSSNYMDYFWLLIKAGAISRVEYILSIYPEIPHLNLTDKEHPETYPILNYAIVNYPDNSIIVRILLAYGANPNSFRLYQNEYGKISALSDAVATAKNIETVKLLLHAGANPNSYRIYQNVYGRTSYGVLGDAIWNAKNVEMVKLLLQAGANANDIEKLIFDDGTMGAKSMLSYAIADANNLDMVKLLLKAGADPNSFRIYPNKYGKTQFSALSDAIWNAKNVEIVKLLLQAGANPNLVEPIIDDKGLTARRSMLSYAIIEAQSQEMVKLLLNYGASWNNIIEYNRKGKIESKFPYHKKCNLSNSFLSFLKSVGWKG